MPTVVFRRLKELEFYSDEIIQMTLDEKRSAIQWAITNKNFSDDTAKANYLMAIVRNNIAAVYRREKDKTEKQSRKSLARIWIQWLIYRMSV